MTALARWRAVYVDKVDINRKRPRLASECNNLRDALYFRRQLIHEISRKVAQIQNPSLGEFKIRDLNDEINRLLREKGYWEDRIRDLGGPDYQKQGPKMLDNEGKEIPGNRGYRYFGAARNLPGVRELFEAEPHPPPKKSSREMMKFIDVDYYGYRDEDDGVILPQERDLETEMLEKRKHQWRENQESLDTGRRAVHTTYEEDPDLYYVPSNPADEFSYGMKVDVEGEDAAASNTASSFGGAFHRDAVPTDEGHLGSDAVSSSLKAHGMLDELRISKERLAGALTNNAGSAAVLITHVPVPSQEEMEKVILEKKRQVLLEQYTSIAFLNEQEETRKMLGLADEEDVVEYEES